MTDQGGKLRVVVPGEEFLFTPGAARALLRILLKAAVVAAAEAAENEEA